MKEEHGDTMRCKSTIQAVGNYTRQIIICSTDALAKKTKKCQTAFRLKENRLVRGRGWEVGKMNEDDKKV